MPAVVTQEKTQRPARQLTAEKLTGLGVRRLNRYNLALQCVTCGETWAPEAEHGKPLPRGYWRCPNRCNW